MTRCFVPSMSFMPALALDWQTRVVGLQQNVAISDPPEHGVETSRPVYLVFLIPASSMERYANECMFEDGLDSCTLFFFRTHCPIRC